MFLGVFSSLSLFYSQQVRVVFSQFYIAEELKNGHAFVLMHGKFYFKLASEFFFAACYSIVV